MRNIFIVFEGIDGCGKSTQVSHLHNYLFRKDKRVRILSTREPTYGQYGKKVREMLSKHADPYSDSDKLLDLYVKDREEHLKHVIKPFLKSKDDNIHIVLCDRYYYSTIVYQSVQGVDTTKVIDLNKDFLKPDLTIICDLEPEIALKRISSGRAIEKFEKLDFMKKLRTRFLDLKELMPDNIAYIDTSGTEKETFDKIRKEVERTFPFIDF